VSERDIQGRYGIDELILDPDNPRLPEELQGGTQAAILSYLYDNATLDELARSFIDNGFFEHEPLMVTGENGKYVTLEGNRRLAALKVLFQAPEALEAELEFDVDEPTQDRREELQRIPAFVVPSRDDVRKYLGFRHIGGIKTWSAEAKARYLTDEVERAVVAESANPFRDVARRVGSNVQGVRNSYIAMATLRAARDIGIKVDHVQHRRFGVWLRAMNSPELREYIGLDNPRSYEDVRLALDNLDREHIEEVLGDMTPAEGTKRPVLADSRDVTIYALVLANSRAHSALRRYQDFEVARQIVEQAELPKRVRQLARSIELVIDEVSRAETQDVAVFEAAEELFAQARSLLAIATFETPEA
jgi:hypothetical protein